MQSVQATWQRLAHEMPPASCPGRTGGGQAGIHTMSPEAGTLELLLVFAPEAPALRALELCVNFGLFASREATRRDRRPRQRTAHQGLAA